MSEIKKTITVVSTGSRTGKVLETSVVNWSALQTELSKLGVNHSGMKAVIGKSKVNLENPEAILPDEDFTLFLYPIRTKSGAVYTPAQIASMSYGEVRAAIKLAIEADPEGGKAHFNVDKNYTVKSTNEIKALLTSYKSKTEKPAKATEVAKEVVKTPSVPAAKDKSSTPTRSKLTAKEEVKSTSTSVATNLDTDEKRVDFIIELINDMTKATQSQKNEAIASIAGLVASPEVKGKGSSSKSLDMDSLMREANDIKRGLSGVQ